MARAISLHLGLNAVDPRHYDGWDGALFGCEFDASEMKAIADNGRFESSMLLSGDAVADAVIAGIERAAQELASGDLFLLTYAGLGGLVPDHHGASVDRTDRTWLAYDRQIVDDELHALWSKFQPGVRILVISDSCHSGTVTRQIEAEVAGVVATRDSTAAESPRYRAAPRDVVIATYRAHAELYDGIQVAVPSPRDASVTAAGLIMSACQDDQLSLDGARNGLFTETLLAVWADGRWDGGGYRQFYEAIRRRMPASQQPNYERIGAPNASFEKENPFTIA